MKLKYFLRGLGVGVVFGALIMLVAYMTSGGYKLSDEEVIKRAEKLGMVKEESSIPAISDEDTEEAMDESTDEPTTSEEATTEDMAQTEEEPVSEEVVDDTTEELTEEVTTEATTEEPVTTAEDVLSGDYTTATIEVVSGMSSYEIAQLLENAGIIEDAADFDSYLNANGYSTQLKINTYTFDSNMTYEEIAEALIKEDAE